MTHDPTFWLLARASGMTAYVLVTLSVLAGLVLKSRPFARLRPGDGHAGPPRARAERDRARSPCTASRSCSTRPSRCRRSRSSIPGLIAYRPLATSLGVLAAELTILVYASFSLRRRIGFRAWRALHWATYADLRARAPFTVSRPAPTPAGPGPQRSTSAPSERSRSRPRGAPSHRKEQSDGHYSVLIDRSLCSGYGICADLAPGRDRARRPRRGDAARRRRPTTTPSSPRQTECPMGAIAVLETASGRRAA